MGYVYFVPDAVMLSPDREARALARLVERLKADGSRVEVGVACDHHGLPRVRLSVSDPPKSRRPPCGARTRAGTPCRARCVPGSERCRLHGGLSTGPKTQAGRERISEANRRRWEAYRAQKTQETRETGKG